MIDNDELITGWAGNDILVTKGIKRVYEDVKSENSAGGRKLVSEDEVSGV